jgi:hypothetical protein
MNKKLPKSGKFKRKGAGLNDWAQPQPVMETRIILFSKIREFSYLWLLKK